MRTSQLFRMTAIGRSFVLLAVGAPILWTRDAAGILALATIGLVWAVAQLAPYFPRLGAPVPPPLEGAVVGIVCGLTLAETPAVLAVLAVAPFVAGLYRGLGGMAITLSTQLIAIVAVAFALRDGLSPAASQAVFTWTVVAVGLGLTGDYLRSTLLAAPDELAPYRQAQSLIRELIDLSSGLSSGLDVASLGGDVVSSVRDRLPTAALALYVAQGDTLAPLIAEPGVEGDLDDCERMAVAAWVHGEVRVEGGAFGFPVGHSAVVGGVLSDLVHAVGLDLPALLGTVSAELRGRGVQMETALLFARFRDTATADERRRLAREMHDGVAQDIASLGYLVDALSARPASATQAAQLDQLRERITSIVGEVRRSVLTLRTSVGENESLGAAIAALARRLSASSGVPIQVTTDEHTVRLRPEVEAELFRIAQEAITNAIKHAEAGSIDVHCQVHPPGALITVADDGRGLQQPRHDSHGLTIMRERARLAGASLALAPRPSGGLVVRVEIDGSRGTRPVEPVHHRIPMHHDERLGA